MGDESHAHQKPILRGRANAPWRDAQEDHRESHRCRHPRPHLEMLSLMREREREGMCLQRTPHECVVVFYSEPNDHDKERNREGAKAGWRENNCENPILKRRGRSNIIQCFGAVLAPFFSIWTTQIGAPIIEKETDGKMEIVLSKEEKQSQLFACF